MKKLKYFLLSILTTLSLYSEHILKEMIIVYHQINKIDYAKLIKFSYSNTDFLLIFILTIILYLFYKKYHDIPKHKGYLVLSLFFAFFLVFGFSYSVLGNANLVFNNFVLVLISLIKFITYTYLINLLLNIIYLKVKELDLNKIKIPNILKKFKNHYELHPYFDTVIIILILWLPYIISFYPAILSPDPANQIKQYFNLETHYALSVKLIDPNVLITNHHPVFHTFILGGFAKIGYNLGSINLGLFMFTIFQLFLIISAITYMLVYLKKLKVPFIYRFIILLIFGLVPVFPLYALSSVKDTFFGALLVFYLIEFHKLLTNQNYKFINYLTLCFLSLFMMLVRNNGLYIVLFSFPFLIYFVKNKKLPLIIVLISSIFIYEAHNKILLPTLHITNGSIREALSIPFQQTARYVKYYAKDLDDDEIKAIDKILNYDTLAKRYKPNISDPVKNEFNKDYTKEDLTNYFKVWFNCFFRHPNVYFDATINTVYGYFYPNTSNWYIYYKYHEALKESGFDYHYNNLNVSRKVLSSYGVAYPYIPVLGSIVNIGFITWTYLFLLVTYILEKKKNLITLIIPALTLILILVAGPVNTYFRYVFPIVLSLPLILGITYQEIKKA